MSPLISIGISFYNNDKTLGDSIRSVFAQTFQDWELILVDDHSLDQSLSIARSVSDRRVRVYKGDDGKGLSYQLNRITKLAKGRFYARMDADDMMHPERISKQVAFLDKNRDIDLVDTGMYSINQNSIIKGIRNLTPIDYRPENLLGRGLLCHATVMSCIDWFRKNPYDTRYLRLQDRELWCRTYKFSKFARVKEPLYFCREGQVNVNKYLIGGKTERLIIKNYGPRLVGKGGTLRLLAISHIKCLAYLFLGLLGIHEILVNMRNKAPSDQVKMDASKIITNILATSVGGLKDSE